MAFAADRVLCSIMTYDGYYDGLGLVKAGIGIQRVKIGMIVCKLWMKKLARLSYVD